MSTDQLVGVEVIVERQSVDVGGVLAAEIMNMRLNTGGCGIVMLWPWSWWKCTKIFEHFGIWYRSVDI